MAATASPRRPASAKAPADHLPKASKPEVEKVDGGWTLTLDGLTVTVLEKRLGNYDLAREIAASEAGNMLAGVRAIGLLFGDEERKIAAHIADEDGIVDPARMGEFFRAAIEAISPNS